MKADFNLFLIEGMSAIRGLLEGRLGKPDQNAALAIAEVMHNMQPNPVLLGVVEAGLDRLRDEHPAAARLWLRQTYAWHDSKKRAE